LLFLRYGADATDRLLKQTGAEDESKKSVQDAF